MLDAIQAKRRQIWQMYYDDLKPVAGVERFELPVIPDYATNNAHMFYLVLPSLEKRTSFIAHLKLSGILSVFHYLSLNASDYYRDKKDSKVAYMGSSSNYRR